jgi:EpsI family protein
VQSYAASGNPVHLSIAYYYSHQRQGAELITWASQAVHKETEFVVSETQRSIMIDGRQLDVYQAVVRSHPASRMVWRWYWVGGTFTSNPYYAKLLELKARLTASRPSGATITLWREYDKDESKTGTDMQDFLNHTSILTALPGATSQS